MALLCGFSAAPGGVSELSEDGRKRRNRPKAVLATLMGDEPRGEGEVRAFDTAEEYEAERAKILKEVTKHGD